MNKYIMMLSVISLLLSISLLRTSYLFNERYVRLNAIIESQQEILKLHTNQNKDLINIVKTQHDQMCTIVEIIQK